MHRALSLETKTLEPYEELAERIADNLGYAQSALSGSSPLYGGGVDNEEEEEAKARRQSADNSTSDESSQEVGAQMEVMEYDVALGAGDGGVAVREEPIAQYKLNYVPLPNLKGRRPRDAFLTRVIGQSMEPDFMSGEKVVVEPYPEGSTQIQADAIYAFRINGLIQIKQIQFVPPRRLLVKSRNPEYDPYEIELDNGTDFEIIGRVWGKFKRY